MCLDLLLLVGAVVCCSVLQWNARVANVFRSAATCGCCGVLQCVAVCCSVMQGGAVCCIVLQCVAVRYSALQLVAVCGSFLQCVAVCCSGT